MAGCSTAGNDAAADGSNAIDWDDVLFNLRLPSWSDLGFFPATLDFEWLSDPINQYQPFTPLDETFFTTPIDRDPHSHPFKENWLKAEAPYVAYELENCQDWSILELGIDWVEIVGVPEIATVTRKRCERATTEDLELMETDHTHPYRIINTATRLMLPNSPASWRPRSIQHVVHGLSNIVGV